MKMRGKKGVSPLIATVLLILIVVVLAMIILAWFLGFVKEAITKEIGGNEKTVDSFCYDVEITSVINEDGSFGFENSGNVPIHAYNVELVGGSDSEIVKVSQEDGGSVNPGFSALVPNENYYEGGSPKYKKVRIIPILLGKTKSGDTQEFECPEKSGIAI